MPVARKNRIHQMIEQVFTESTPNRAGAVNPKGAKKGVEAAVTKRPGAVGHTAPGLH
jgi:hypothetical protein